MSGCDFSFRAMGSEVRLIVSGPAAGAPSADDAVRDSRRFIDRFEQALSRFRPDSELCRLNDDPREAVPASPLLRDAVRAGIWAARWTDGLVDPTLVGEIEAAGYVESREGMQPASLTEALDFAPPRRPARPRPGGDWTRITVDEAYGVIRRPPGVRFDTGGVGKGLAADLLAERLARYGRYVVNCGGDLRVGGADPGPDPFEVLVEHPLTGELSYRIRLGSGAVATSGLNVRVWRRDGGGFAHHLLDPSSGEPAWTGLVAATALGETAVEAETLAKAAVLSGADRARKLLAPTGGLLVHEDGRVERIGPLDATPRYSITVPASLLGDRVAV